MADISDILDKATSAYAAGDISQAIRYYTRAASLDENCVEALEWLGELYVQSDKLKRALKFYERAMDLNPNFSEHANLGYCYYELGDSKKAVAALQRAIIKDSNDDTSHSNYGKALYDYFVNTDADEARHLALQWSKGFPNNKDAQYMGAAISGKACPEVADVAFVRETFDDFADDFDKKLGELDYAAPRLLAEVFSEFGCAGMDRILDLGCGTGLLGVPLRSLLPSAYLLGVDLSPKMLKQSEKRKLYSDLQCAELVQWLHENRSLEPFDLIIAADVLCYFGDLLPLLQNASKLIKAGGLLIFSIELGECENYSLHVSGRYRHAANYPQKLAETLGLNMLCCRKDVLRTEYGAPVYGLLVAFNISIPTKSLPSK